MRFIPTVGAAAVLLALSTLGIAPGGCKEPIPLPGLGSWVRVYTDEVGIPHVYARTWIDAIRVQGYLHARARWFQMDTLRHRADGRLAELTGSLIDLFEDPQARLLGFRAAAEREVAAASPTVRAFLEAYAEGVNAWLAVNPLPAEYEDLEIARVAPWTPVDSFLLAKASSAVSLRAYEISDTGLLGDYVEAGQRHGFDGQALFFEDLARVAPMDPAATVPDAGGALPFVDSGPGAGLVPSTRASSSARKFAMDGLSFAGSTASSSTWWAVAAAHSAEGVPLIANDPHTARTAPPNEFEMHVVVEEDPRFGRIDVAGMSSIGLPNVFFVGQTPHLAWGVTGAFFDLFDVFDDRLVRGDAECPTRLCIATEEGLHPVEERLEEYRLNLRDDGVLDNSQDFTSAIEALAPVAVRALSVPFRSFGPIAFVEDRNIVDDPGTSPGETSVLTFQWTALDVTRDGRAIFAIPLARDVSEFRDAVRMGPNATWNWIVADAQDGLAYVTGAEVPLRADLEAGRVHGNPPFLIRDGSGPANWIRDDARSEGQTLPYRVLPFDEMPQVVNPPAGYVINANNDWVGASLDNDLFDQYRLSNPGAIYYLGSIDFQGDLRAGRARQLIRQRIDADEKIGVEDMKRFQADSQQRDAQIMVPYLLTAWQNAASSDRAELVALAQDGALAEAIARLEAWDFTTPTGIPEGYDASDVDGVRSSEVPPEEAANSVAATLYNVWRSELIDAVIVGRLAGLELEPIRGRRSFRLLPLLLGREPFTGVGASGLDFFPEPVGLAPAERRDVALLSALRGSLDALASDRFAAAFGGSTSQADYRWGRLHRISIPHAVGDPRSIPFAGGFADLAPALPGIPRDGGYHTLNRGTRGRMQLDERIVARSNGFEFNDTSSEQRRVMAPGHALAPEDGVLAFSSQPGGPSGDAQSPFYASRLGRWLTSDYDPVRTDRRWVRLAAQQRELFRPVR